MLPAAFLMVAFISWVVRRSVSAETGIDIVVDLILLVMMVGMLVGPAYLFFVTANFGVGDVAIWEIAVFMMVGMMPIGVLLFAKYWMQSDPERTGPLPLTNMLSHHAAVKLSFIALLVLSEFLMGWTFNLALGLIDPHQGNGILQIGGAVAFNLTSYWFVFTMVGEMGLTLFALRKTIPGKLTLVLILQAVIMLFTPTAVPSGLWVACTIWLEAALMTSLVVFTFIHLRRSERGDRTLPRYLAMFIIVNTVMMAGFLIWLANGSLLLLALSLVMQTVLYFDAVFSGAGFGRNFESRLELLSPTFSHQSYPRPLGIWGPSGVGGARTAGVPYIGSYPVDRIQIQVKNHHREGRE